MAAASATSSLPLSESELPPPIQPPSRPPNSPTPSTRRPSLSSELKWSVLSSRHFWICCFLFFWVVDTVWVCSPNYWARIWSSGISLDEQCFHSWKLWVVLLFLVQFSFFFPLFSLRPNRKSSFLLNCLIQSVWNYRWRERWSWN